MCAACNAEPRRTPGAGRAGRGVERTAPVRAVGPLPLVGLLHAAGRECGEPDVDAADGRIVVAVPVLREPADGTSPAARGRGCGTAPGPPADAPDGSGSALPQAAHEQPAARAPHLPVPAPGPDDRPPESGLVRRHHLHSGVSGFLVPGRGHGLGQPSRAGLALVEYDGHRLLHRGAGSGASDGHAGRSSTPIRGRSLPAPRSPSGCWRRARNARWTAAGGAWTTSSSSGCGGR